MSLALRAARMEDAERLLMWRNDIETRAASLNQAEIDESSHGAWLGIILVSAHSTLYMIEEDGVPVGTGRLDDCPETGIASSARASWTVAPAHRGRGLAVEVIGLLLREAWRRGYDGVTAVVKADNPKSLKAALAAGFRPSSEVWLEVRRPR